MGIWLHSTCQYQILTKNGRGVADARSEAGDYAAAAAYIQQAAPAYAQNRWSRIESAMLKLYSQCLKKLDRKEEYVKVVLTLLAKSAANEQARLLPRMRISDTATVAAEQDQPETNWLDEDYLDTIGYLRELVTFSETMSHNVSVPFQKYFSNVHVEPYVRHFPDRDGFQLKLRFRHLLEDDILVHKASVRLTSTAPGHNRDILLESTEPVRLTRGSVKIWVCTNVCITACTEILLTTFTDTYLWHFRHRQSDSPSRESCVRV